MACGDLKRIFATAALALLAVPRLLEGANLDRTLTERYCLACHSDSLRTAGVSLEGKDPNLAGNEPAIWERVFRKLASGEMPPSDAPGPSASERGQFVAALERALDAAAKKSPNPGRPPAHRLNRAEYSNAVRDLLDLEIDVRSMLPADDSGYGFDNIADVLSLTPALLDRYMLAARRVSRLAVGSGQVKPERDLFVRNRETGFRNAGHAPASRHELPLGTRDGATIRYYFPRTGRYRIEAALDQGDTRTSYEHRALSLEVEAGLRTLALAFLGESSRAERTRPDGADSSKRPHPPLEVRLDGRRLELVEVPDTDGAFKIRWISVEGPFGDQRVGDTPSRRRIFSCRPQELSEETPCARRILASLARKAYRRPAEPADINALMGVFEIGQSEDGFEKGIEMALRALLVSPHFLFRVERDPDGAEPGRPYRLPDIDLASRLSFFLWSSSPDEELLATAEQGRLGDRDEFERQVRRMLADRRSWALVENFAGQWLELRNVDKVKPDEVLFPEFDANLRSAMRRETELFFADILRSNGSVLEFLDSDKAFLNERLAEHYGLGHLHGDQFREVRLDDPRRGGLLGQGSVLTLTSYPNRTSVVIRGQWVLKNLFGMPPPPAPPDIPELERAASDGEHRTLRELMALHSRAPTCASCHVRMDPIGFALENFDAIGRWRETDGTAPIDASGSLPGGIAFDGPGELRRVLATELRDAFVGTLAGKLLTYSLGRGLEHYDRAVVRSLVREAERTRYRFADLIVAVTQSMPFQMRRAAER